MFKLFTRKPSELPKPCFPKPPMPQVKEPKFLSKDEANKISQDFINSGEYDEGTLRLIRYIEEGIKYNASHGFKEYEYKDENGFPFVKYCFNEDLLINHFKKMRYPISIYSGGVSSSGLYCKIKIRWE